MGKSKDHESKWLYYDIMHKKPSETYHESVKEYFYSEMVKEPATNSVNNNSSFSMTYNGDTATTLPKDTDNDYRNYLENQYEEYQSILLGLSQEEFCKSMQQILQSEKSNDELQNELFEMLGIDGFELILKLLENRRNIVQYAADQQELAEKKFNKKLLDNKASRAAPAMGSQIVVQSKDEKLFAKQLRKLEKKAEKDRKKSDWGCVEDYEPDLDHNEEEVEEAYQVIIFIF